MEDKLRKVSGASHWNLREMGKAVGLRAYEMGRHRRSPRAQWVDVFGEPVHFIMEQKMLRTIKELSEHG